MVSAAWPLLLIKGYHSKCLCLEEQGPLNSLGTFHYAKISGNFGPNVNGTVRPRWKFPVKVVFLQRWSSLTGRSGPVWPKIAVPFSQIFVSSPAPAGHHSQNGEWFRCKCSVCKPQMQDLNFVLMHSCTQGSGTAAHLNLFFLLVFISF